MMETNFPKTIHNVKVGASAASTFTTATVPVNIIFLAHNFNCVDGSLVIVCAPERNIETFPETKFMLNFVRIKRLRHYLFTENCVEERQRDRGYNGEMSATVLRSVVTGSQSRVACNAEKTTNLETSQMNFSLLPQTLQKSLGCAGWNRTFTIISFHLVNLCASRSPSNYMLLINKSASFLVQ
jgi:hypothetical protein